MDNRSNKMLIDATHPEETRVVVLRNGRVEEFDFESASRRPLRGNIYLAKVTRVEPSLQAAFVEYGGNRHGFLAFAEIHPDYYQIPKADRDALVEEEVAAELEADQEADERAERMAHRGGRDQPRDNRDNRGDIADAPGTGDQPSMLGDASSGEAVLGALMPGDTDQPRDADTAHQDTSHQDAAHQETAHHSAAEASGLADPTVSAALEDERPAAAQADHDASPAASADHDAHRHADHAGDTASDFHGESSADANGDLNHVEEVPANAEEPELIDGSDEQPSSADASEEMPERPRRQRRRSYKIQEVIKRRQIMLIQVVKEERGTKGAALTTYLSLAGRYTVLMPNTGRGGGISRKITQPQDRKRLKAIAQDLDVPEGMGLIIRTAGASRSLQEIRRDYDYLLRLWDSVRELTLSSTAPSLVYEEGSLIKRSIRDQYTKDVDEIVVAGVEAHREAQDFMRMLMPSHAKNVILHDRPEPLFARYPIVDRQLNALFSPQVPLKSGGYLVINQTEALVAIDINSGKSTREFSIEDTALNTNLEASDEIARQVKLRDLAGLIVIDYIDMEEKRNNRSVERRLKDALRFDRARIQVGRISHFGLMEMSRQRMRTGVLEGSTSKCPHCEGTGIIRSVESVALAVLRGLDEHLQRDGRSSVNVHAHQDVALYILNHKRSFIADLERRFGVFVAVLSSDKHQGANFHIERSATPPPPRREPQRAPVAMHTAFTEQDAIDFAEEEGEDPRPATPVIESDIESIDTGDGYEDEPRHSHRGGDRGRDRDRGGRDRGGRGESRGESRGEGRGDGRRDGRGDRGDRGGDRGDRGGDRGDGAPRPDAQEAGDDASRGDAPRGDERPRNDEDGGRRRSRRRGRGRDRDDRSRERGGERGDRPYQPRDGAQPLAADGTPQPAGLEGDAFEAFDDAVPTAPRLLGNEDDTPELINGDGIDGEAAADAGTASSDAAREEEGRRRRRRGRRGGRRGRDEAPGEGGPMAEAGDGDVSAGSTASFDEVADNNEPPHAPRDEFVADAVVADTVREPAPERPSAKRSAPERSVPHVAAPAVQSDVAVVEPEPARVAPADRPIASEPVIESDAPARPARRGFWRTRGIG